MNSNTKSYYTHNYPRKNWKCKNNVKKCRKVYKSVEKCKKGVRKCNKNVVWPYI